MSERAPRKILLLSANPHETGRLRIDEETREIKEGLKRSRKRDEFVLETAEAARYRDLRRQILDIAPNIVHFSGHGAGEEGLIFEDESGKVTLIGSRSLAGLFELFSDSIECVVLNACYSRVQAEAIAENIPYIVGMGSAIGDRAAIEFAIAFYDALANGRDYEFAYKYACNGIALAGIPESDTPELLKGKVNAAVFPSESEKSRDGLRDDSRGTFIGNYAPNVRGSNLISGREVSGNTFIGTQNINSSIVVPVPMFDFGRTDNSGENDEETLEENYFLLDKFLSEKKWKQAEIETERLMFKLADQQGKGQLDEEDIISLPYGRVAVIDRLWEQYSQGRFGFNVQRKIWLELGGKLDPETKIQFGERVGWVKKGRWLDYSDLSFNLKAPAGQFPLIWSLGSWVVAGLSYDRGLIFLARYHDFLQNLTVTDADSGR